MLIRQQNATSNWKAISIINKKIFSSRISLFLFYVKNGYRANNKKMETSFGGFSKTID